MISLEVRSWSSPDVELGSHTEVMREAAYFLVELEIGEAGVDGADVFYVVVTTPEALRVKATEGDPVLRDRATLVVSDFDWPRIRATLERIVETCAAKDWRESVLRLQRYFKWEYEDYRRDDGG